MITKPMHVTEVENEVHQEKWGGFNTPPPGWREVTEAEIATISTIRTHAPSYEEYRRIKVSNTEPYLAVRLFFMHDETGVGLSFDYWNKKVRWFMFGCDHDYETWWPVVFERHDRCRKCGLEQIMDTSG